MFGRRVQAWLGAPRAPWIAFAIAMALAAPALTATFTADDHIQRIVAREDTGIPGLASMPFDRFVFANGARATATALRDTGVFPWYVDLDVRLAFWRPVSSFTHQIDTWLWPESATAALAHNLAWHAVGLVLVWLFFRRMFGAARWIAVLAFALYALDDARGPVVGWIANRNALVALALSLPALIAHDRWRREGWERGRWIALAMFAVALGAGESTIAITAYLGAHAICLDRAPWRSRLLALAPYVVIVVAWRVVYAKLGYGTAGSGVYIDPGADPAGFLEAAVTRVPFLLAAQLAGLWSDFASFYPIVGVLGTMLAIAGALVAGIVGAAARILRRDPLARFFALGTLLAAIPVASTFPADRLLPFIGLGGAGLVAQLLAAALADRSQLGDGRLRRLYGACVALFLVLVHLVIGPPFLALRARSMVTVGAVIDRANDSLPRDPALATKTLVLVVAPSDALAGYLPLMRASLHQPNPAHLVWLAVGSSQVTVERVDDHTLRITSARGLLEHQIDQMLRTARIAPFRAGDTIALPTVTITVEAITPDGRPQRYTARFTAPLADPSHVWLTWRAHGYAPYTLPATRDSLPPIALDDLLE